MAAPTVSPTVVVTAELIEGLVASGGYTHPLFNPTPAQRSSGVAAPLPGQGVLLLAGGLAEQSGALDDAIALVELKSVTFLRMVRAGQVLSLELTPGVERATKSGKVIREYRWLVREHGGDPVMEATAVMLMNQGSQE
ncbi:MaoC family dehydratase [Dactylosporangium sucinum]|uniref:Uncharacterized protein n=1 Tax=Dactylosporangium sucinum TaxID=1424081 RepID=A0A917U0D9_9ACTN|nr:MaoC family dehydratase [Dactylosporangium sucinum]GGM46107.1 hypothetical protein GCM10007977_054820 [Dactylosporangium sucinum]